MNSEYSQRRTARAPGFVAVVAMAVAFAVSAMSPVFAAEQQESYTFTLGLLGGVGGSFDADPEPGLGQSNYMLEFGMITEPRTMVAVRAGKMTIDGDEGFEQYREAELEFVNVAGEYRFAQSFYDYGLYIGVGYYQLSGDLRSGADDRESDIGLAIGMTGDFDVTRHISVIGEISAHYAFLDSAALYGMAQIGLAVHF